VPNEPTIHDTIRAAAMTDRLWRADDLAVPADAMARMSLGGSLERIIPGVYLGVEHQRTPLTEAAAWTLKHPGAVTCLLTAAVYNDLTDAFAGGTWLYVLKGTSPPRSTVVPVNVVQTIPKFAGREFDDLNGITGVQVHGIQVRVTGPDRTTLDLWRYPRRISAEHALEALRRRVRADSFQVSVFARLARRLGVWSKVEPVMQGLVLR